MMMWMCLPTFFTSMEPNTSVAKRRIEHSMAALALAPTAVASSPSEPSNSEAAVRRRPHRRAQRTPVYDLDAAYEPGASTPPSPVPRPTRHNPRPSRCPLPFFLNRSAPSAPAAACGSDRTYASLVSLFIPVPGMTVSRQFRAELEWRAIGADTLAIPRGGGEWSARQERFPQCYPRRAGEAGCAAVMDADLQAFPPSASRPPPLVLLVPEAVASRRTVARCQACLSNQSLVLRVGRSLWGAG